MLDTLIQELRQRGDDLSQRAAAELERVAKIRRSNLAATVAAMTPERVAKFWSLVDKSGGPDACWPWKGRCNHDGYGHAWIGGRADKRAHRVACELVGKHQPEKYEADHLCGNRPCCNPAHIQFIPGRENKRRSSAPHALNAQKEHCKWGHPLSGDNVRIFMALADRMGTGKRKPTRVCLACVKRRSDEAKAKRAASRAK